MCTDVEKAAGDYYITEFDVSWRPTRGLESRTLTTCLVMHETSPDLAMFNQVTRCAKFQVAKCQTCVKAGDTLLSLAQDYKTDWLQLWGANVNVGNPNKLVPPSENQEVITLGPTHVIDKPVTLALLAKRFRMTPDRILELNPDMAARISSPSEMVAVQTHVCLMPEICTVAGEDTFA